MRPEASEHFRVIVNASFWRQHKRVRQICCCFFFKKKCFWNIRKGVKLNLPHVRHKESHFQPMVPRCAAGKWLISPLLPRQLSAPTGLPSATAPPTEATPTEQRLYLRLTTLSYHALWRANNSSHCASLGIIQNRSCFESIYTVWLRVKRVLSSGSWLRIKLM